MAGWGEEALRDDVFDLRGGTELQETLGERTCFGEIDCSDSLLHTQDLAWRDAERAQSKSQQELRV